jgi:hypothetical protein
MERKAVQRGMRMWRNVDRSWSGFKVSKLRMMRSISLSPHIFHFLVVFTNQMDPLKSMAILLTLNYRMLYVRKCNIAQLG